MPSSGSHIPDKFARIHKGGEWEGRLVQMLRAVVWNAEDMSTLLVYKGHPDQDSVAADAAVAKREERVRA